MLSVCFFMIRHVLLHSKLLLTLSSHVDLGEDLPACLDLLERAARSRWQVVVRVHRHEHCKKYVMSVV